MVCDLYSRCLPLRTSESGTNGVVGDSIPNFAGPLQVFVRLVSVHAGLELHHSVTGTIRVTVMTPDIFHQSCPGTAGGCGGPFTFPTVCGSIPVGAPATLGGGCPGVCPDQLVTPVPVTGVGCVRDFPLPYPYPGN